jgi:UDP-N-acetylglucosamine 4-epimerase
VDSHIDSLDATLREQPRHWVVTGAAGFIGSNLVEALLRLDQHVVGLDNLSTGHLHNVNEVLGAVSPTQAKRYRFVQGDITDAALCREVCRGADVVLHQAALGSVPRSIADPIATNRANVDGFLNMLVAARDERVQRFVYAASSSTYGDHPDLPKVESKIGRPLSPYAVTKLVNELYADVFHRCFDLTTIGLRYFNVFGKRQDPEGAYAAVIPRWIRALMSNDAVLINGDGETSRDFCFVDNAVQANLRAATVRDAGALNQVYNVAVGQRTTLNALNLLLRETLAVHTGGESRSPTRYGPSRPGDVRHSLADISRAMTLLKYRPTHDVAAGLHEAMPWYVSRLGAAPVTSRLVLT